MAIDFAALQAALETDTVYDVDVVGGHNGKLVAMLNAPDPALPKRWMPISVNDFLDAISLEPLTATQEERIRTYTANISMVPVHKQNVRQWIMNQGWSAATLAKLKALSEVPGRLVDSFADDEGGSVSLQDVRNAVKLISKSYITQWKAGNV